MGTAGDTTTREEHCPLCGPCGHAPRASLPDKRAGHAGAQWPLLRCNYCNLLFLGRRPLAWPGPGGGAEDAREDAGDVAAAAAAGCVAPALVLALGCGDGRELEAWRAAHPGARLVGVDRDPAASGRIRAKGFEAVVCEAERLLDAEPGLRGACDVVVCVDALDECDDPRAVLRTARALLCEGGLLVVRGVDAGGRQERRFRAGAWHAYDAPRRAFHFNPFNLARLAGNEGFEKTSCDALPDARGWIRSWRAELAARGADAGLLGFFRDGNPLLAWWHRAADLRAVRRGERTSRMRLVARARAGGVRDGNSFAPSSAAAHEPRAPAPAR